MKHGLIRSLMVPTILGGVILGSCQDTGDESKDNQKPDIVTSTPFVGKQIIPIQPVSFSPIDSILSEGCYTVQKGDNLYDLGEKFYGAKAIGHAIADWNDIELESVDVKFYARLYPGQDLMLKQINLRQVEPGYGWSNIAQETGLTINQAQQKFHWIGNQLVPGEIYFTE